MLKHVPILNLDDTKKEYLRCSCGWECLLQDGLDFRVGFKIGRKYERHVQTS